MERMWVARMRWRMRGAWMWPAFAVLTVVDGLLAHAVPIAGDATGLWPALLLGSFLNLVIVAVAAPLAGIVVRRRRPDLPRVVAGDYAGTALMGAVTVALMAAGLAHRPAVVESRRDFHAQSQAVRQYVIGHAGGAYRRRLDLADTRRIDEDLYRTCVPGPDPKRAMCLIVDTDRSPPGLRIDPDRETNQSFAGRRGASPGG